MPVAARRLGVGHDLGGRVGGGRDWSDGGVCGCPRHEQRRVLDRQVARLTDWAASNAPVVAGWCVRSGPG